jgi:Predicted permeases
VKTEGRMKIAGGASLGLAGLALLVVLRIATADQPIDQVPAPLLDGLTLALSVLIESLPFIVLGIALSVLVQVWVPQTWLFRILPKNAVAKRFVISLLGMFLPVCECGNVPLARGLVARGYSVSDSMTFLLAAPIINPVTIITTHQAFGFDDGILVARIIGAIVIANVLGWGVFSPPQPRGLAHQPFCRPVSGETVG